MSPNLWTRFFESEPVRAWKQFAAWKDGVPARLAMSLGVAGALAAFKGAAHDGRRRGALYCRKDPGSHGI